MVAKPPSPLNQSTKGFTLIELLVVLAIMATLVSIVGPKYFHSVDRAKEAALKANLHMVRDAIDKFKADTGHYPQSLQDLVDGRYLRSWPIDPVLDADKRWILIAPPSQSASGIYDIKSSAPGVGGDGRPYRDW